MARGLSGSLDNDSIDPSPISRVPCGLDQSPTRTAINRPSRGTTTTHRSWEASAFSRRGFSSHSGGGRTKRLATHRSRHVRNWWMVWWHQPVHESPGNHEFVGRGNLLCRSTVFPACWRSNAFFETRWFGWGVRGASDGGHDQGYAAQILDHPNNGFLSDDDRAYDPGLANADGTDVPNPPPEYEWWWGVRGGNWLNARWPLACASRSSSSASLRRSPL